MHVDINNRAPIKVFLALKLVLLCASATAASAQDDPYQVLVLHSFRASLPVNADWLNGVMRGFASARDVRVEIDIEAPDLSRFADADYVSNLLGIYRWKYRDHKPHLIIPTYTPALQFLIDHGEDLFKGVPIVFLGADKRFVAAQDLAPHITGITSHRDIAGTLQLALQLHPNTQRVAAIVGSGDLGKSFERDARQAFEPLEGRVKFTWLKGMPLDELVEAVRKLPRNVVILYLVQLQDRNGQRYIPRNFLKTLAGAANAPIYGLWDTLLEDGIIGGRLATLEDDAYQAAQMGLRILRGETPVAVPVVDRTDNRAIFHGGELARWNISEERLPAGSHVEHRQRSFWAEHRTKIIVAGLVMGLQGLLIFALLLNWARVRRMHAVLQDENHRRRQAEAFTHDLKLRLTSFSRERTLGAMTTTIAHEINQPLIAIQNYAQAAKRRAQNHVSGAARLNELIDKIGQQAARAGDIIKHVRNLVNEGNAVKSHPVSLASVVEQATQMVQEEFEEQACSIDLRLADLPAVLADTLQIQLVLVNLLRNALCNMASFEDKANKVVSIEISKRSDQEQQVSVADRGPSVPLNKVDHIFEPFYSGGQGGMGLGLSICRSIIEAHDGRIWYTLNRSGRGVFHFTLRTAA